MTKDKINEVDNLKKELEELRIRLEKEKAETYKKELKDNKGNTDKFKAFIKELKLKETIEEGDLNNAVRLRSQMILSETIKETDDITNYKVFKDLLDEAVSTALNEEEVLELFNKVKQNDKTKDLIKHNLFIPETFTILGAKAIDKIFDPNQPIQPNTRTEIGAIGKRVITYVTLNPSSALSKEEAILKPYDKLISDTAVTIAKYPANKGIFTIQDINDTLNNLGYGTIRMSNKTESDIEKSLFKVSTTNSIIEYEMEAEAYNKSEYGVKYEGMLLPLEAITVNSGNTKVKAYKLLTETPPLYKYNQVSNHIITATAELFNTTKKHKLKDGTITERRNNTKQYKLIQIYLLREINYMKKSNRNRSIKLDTAVNKIYGNKELSYKQFRSFREDIEHYLRHLKLNKEIKDFKPRKEGRKIVSYNIFLMA